MLRIPAFVTLVGLFVILAQAQTGAGHAIATPQQTATEPWFGFAPYPGARQLCWNRHVLSEGVHPPGYKPVWGRMGTAVVFFTTPDAASKVTAFYAKAERNRDRNLSVHAASGENYPEHQECLRKPEPDEKTVIVLTGTVWGWL